MKVLGKTNDSTPNSSLKRIYYTIEIESDKFVDIMISEENTVIYAMDNGDGTTVYDKNKGIDCTFPNYKYDENKAFNLAIGEYEKEYGEINW